MRSSMIVCLISLASIACGGSEFSSGETSHTSTASSDDGDGACTSFCNTIYPGDASPNATQEGSTADTGSALTNDAGTTSEAATTQEAASTTEAGSPPPATLNCSGIATNTMPQVDENYTYTFSNSQACVSGSNSDGHWGPSCSDCTFDPTLANNYQCGVSLLITDVITVNGQFTTANRNFTFGYNLTGTDGVSEAENGYLIITITPGDCQ